jgi:Bacterial archaeo-eukaryotic release factor family 3
MDSKELDDLVYTKGGPCISIIVRTYRLSPSRMQNKEIIQQATARAERILEHKGLSTENRQLLIDRLKALSLDIDFEHTQDGLGIFVSRNTFKKVLFPFPVSQKIIIDDSFETRDLVYLQQFLTPYHVLVLTKKTIRLFSAIGDKLEELKDEHFPVVHEDDYEYAPPSRGTSFGTTLKAFEKDKGIISAIRLRSTLKLADARLSFYLRDESAKIVIAGSKTIRTDFENETTNKRRIAGSVAGSYSKDNQTELGQSCWSAYAKYQMRQNELLVDQLKEEDMKNVVYGIRNVWKATQEGKGLILFVEKNYMRKAYREANDLRIHLSPLKNSTVINDIVDDIMESVYRKKGKIVFAESGELRDFDRIALLLRYPYAEAKMKEKLSSHENK